MDNVIKGPVTSLGVDINTDDIIPARYLNTSDPEELMDHIFEDMAEKVVVKPGTVIAAGENFGSGSSREHAPIALKAAGVSVILAESLARIFVRNCINIGLLALEVPGAGKLKGDQSVEVDLKAGKIKAADGTELTIHPVPDFIQDIMAAGGLIPWIKAGGLD